MTDLCIPAVSVSKRCLLQGIPVLLSRGHCAKIHMPDIRSKGAT